MNITPQILLLQTHYLLWVQLKNNFCHYDVYHNFCGTHACQKPTTVLLTMTIPSMTIDGFKNKTRQFLTALQQLIRNSGYSQVDVTIHAVYFNGELQWVYGWHSSLWFSRQYCRAVIFMWWPMSVTIIILCDRICRKGPQPLLSVSKYYFPPFTKHVVFWSSSSTNWGIKQLILDIVTHTVAPPTFKE